MSNLINKCDVCKTSNCPLPECMVIRANLALKTLELKNTDKIFEYSEKCDLYYFTATDIQQAQQLIDSGEVYKIAHKEQKIEKI